MSQQMKTFHWWLSMIQLVVGVVAGSQGLLGPKAMQWFIVGNAILNKAIQMMAARWQPDQEEPKLKLPPSAIAKAVLPLLLLPALLVSGCAFGRCELGKLSSAGQIAFATAQDIASNPDSTEVELTKAAFAFLPGQLECASQALLDWLLKKQARKAGLAFGAMTVDPDQHKIAVLRAYLAGKKLACSPMRIGLADPLQLRERPHRAAVALLEPCEDAETCRQIVIDDDVPEWKR